ncbi:HIT-like protein [Macroventuria anomochaeta]|uniref:HIT-like protein n=1 Tax=Macroventuria anomochaeta TaxID=301207 RepID=A0ACB6SGG2_9PLEO|nr:HIT-like protein [Macroventuria anomochaeta]KAF2633047.1 HIT-like protein [Macroventuria anomochaeta]
MFKLSREPLRYSQSCQLNGKRTFHQGSHIMAEASKGKSSNITEKHQDPIVAEEIEGALKPQASHLLFASKRANAFTELMSAKKPKPAAEPAEIPAKPVMRGFDARNGLGLYIEHPEKNPEGLVVEYDDDFVVINDKFPKARYASSLLFQSSPGLIIHSVHLLLIPRKPEYYNQHPLHLLSSNPAFLAEVRRCVDRLKQLAASELRRRYGRHSATDVPYQSALSDLMSSPNPPPASERDALLPPGRDWLSEIKVGVHTHPSMNHMHIHIMSREMHSLCLRHKKHYLSFNSSFFVDVDEFPLEEGSERFHPGDWPSWDMKCWRCGENYKNKFAKLKGHLEEEFEVWRKE